MYPPNVFMSFARYVSVLSITYVRCGLQAKAIVAEGDAFCVDGHTPIHGTSSF